jgi:hypothetical protein
METPSKHIRTCQERLTKHRLSYVQVVVHDLSTRIPTTSISATYGVPMPCAVDREQPMP